MKLAKHWMIKHAFGESLESSELVSEREFQSFVKSIFKNYIKHYRVKPGTISYRDDYVSAEGTVGKIFDKQGANEIRNCIVEIEHHDSQHPGGRITINFIDPETGEIRQKQWHI